MIDAMAELCAEQGYEATKIADVVRRAHVARKTLYDNFAGKEELFLAAFDTTLADARGRVAEACEAIDGGRMGGAHRSRPAGAARVRRRAARRRRGSCLVEAPAATRRLAGPLRGGARRLHRPPARGGARRRPGRRRRWRRRWSAASLWIVQRQIRRGGAADAADLLPELTEFVVSPYRGVGKR